MSNLDNSRLSASGEQQELAHDDGCHRTSGVLDGINELRNRWTIAEHEIASSRSRFSRQKRDATGRLASGALKLVTLGVQADLAGTACHFQFAY